jgi:hypothetical protein
MATHYWPLYGAITGEALILSEAERLRYLLTESLKFGYHRLWILAALVGAAVALAGSMARRDHIRPVGVMIALAIASALYPALSGKFWAYHWLPFLYFLVALSMLSFVASPSPSVWIRLGAPVLLLGVVATRIGAPPQFESQLHGQVLHGQVLHGQVVHDPPVVPQALAIAGYLTPRLSAEDRVQPLDWVSGALHGMLLADARPATRFLHDFHFYHHVSTPYIRDLRARLLHELRSSPPRFLVETRYRDWINWSGASWEFPELEAMLREEYLVVQEGEWYRIYERLGP